MKVCLCSPIGLTTNGSGYFENCVELESLTAFEDDMTEVELSSASRVKNLI